MFYLTGGLRSKFRFFVLVLAALTAFGFGSGSLEAQSTPITVALPNTSATAARYATPPNRRIADSRSAEYLRVEGVLDRASRLPQGATITGADLVQELNDLGVTVIVDVTAIDDSWSDDVKLSVPVGEQPLRSALLNLLRLVNATIVISPEGVLTIVSFDNFQDAEFLKTILYDVSAIATTPGEAYELIDVLQSSVYSDTWEDSGTGEGTVDVGQRNGRVILAINACYVVQRDVQRLLRNYVGMIGGSAVPVRRTPVTLTQKVRSGGSRAIALPLSKTKSGLRGRRGMALPSNGSTSGFGGGGGGVF